MYNWQHKDWANFTYKDLIISDVTSSFVEFSAETNILLRQKKPTSCIKHALLPIVFYGKNLLNQK